MVVAPSDHLILDESGFLDVCRTALETTRNTTSLVTLGIQPTRPDTGYGYIQYEEPSRRSAFRGAPSEDLHGEARFGHGGSVLGLR